MSSERSVKDLSGLDPLRCGGGGGIPRRQLKKPEQKRLNRRTVSSLSASAVGHQWTSEDIRAHFRRPI